MVQENLDTPRLPPNRWNPDARACWEAGGGVVAGEQSSGGRISFSSWSPACRIQLPGRKWEELNRKYMLKSHSRHSRKLRLRWNTEEQRGEARQLRTYGASLCPQNTGVG